MANRSNSSGGASGGAGVLGLLGVAFVVLKLTGFINWPWLWVTVPFWGPVAVALVVVVFCFMMAGVAKLL